MLNAKIIPDGKICTELNRVETTANQPDQIAAKKLGYMQEEVQNSPSS